MAAHFEYSSIKSVDQSLLVLLDYIPVLQFVCPIQIPETCRNILMFYFLPQRDPTQEVVAVVNSIFTALFWGCKTPLRAGYKKTSK